MIVTELIKKIVKSETGRKALGLVTQKYGNSAVMLGLFEAMGQLGDKADALIKELSDETAPQTADKLLSQWERSVGIDADVYVDADIRRNRILMKRTHRAAMNPYYFGEELSRLIGKTVEIREYPGTNKMGIAVVDPQTSITSDDLKTIIIATNQRKQAHIVTDLNQEASIDLPIHSGIGASVDEVIDIGCDIPVIDSFDYLCDEYMSMLLDEYGNKLIFKK